MNIVVLGLTVTSSWGNGHATTYRALLKELARRGHRVLFLERDMPWYAANRETGVAQGYEIRLYESLEQLHRLYTDTVRHADAVIVGSYVPDGVAVGEWIIATSQGVRAFYDIDTPVTLANLKTGTCAYLSRELCSAYDLYLSFTGGPTLDYIERTLNAPRARSLYCSVDPELYFPEARTPVWDLAYLGTYAADRQSSLDSLLLSVATAEPDRSFCVAGPQYPADVEWPPNVERIEHLPAAGHRHFYSSQRWTLNLTRADMIRAGFSPSVRLFEAAACGIPIMSDIWPGLETIFAVDSEILTVRDAREVRDLLQMPDSDRQAIAERARKRVLAEHTAANRAEELVREISAVQAASAVSAR